MSDDIGGAVTIGITVGLFMSQASLCVWVEEERGCNVVLNRCFLSMPVRNVMYECISFF